jgi:two-component system cell cycle response regulator DivK
MTTKSLLIVDDNPENLKLILMLLASSGHELVTATDAVQALQAIERRQPDLILLDLQLPGMDGLELTRRLRANAETKPATPAATTTWSSRSTNGSCARSSRASWTALHDSAQHVQEAPIARG